VIGERRSRRSRERRASIDLAPLIDMVFILLVFFLLTATFIPEQGLGLQRARSTQGEAIGPRALRVAITADGALYLEGRRIDEAVLKASCEARLRSEADARLVLVPDRDLPSGSLVAVMDLAREAGLDNIVVAVEESR
jgi:biopolymer transport protein ExbD